MLRDRFLFYTKKKTEHLLFSSFLNRLSQQSSTTVSDINITNVKCSMDKKESLGNQYKCQIPSASKYPEQWGNSSNCSSVTAIKSAIYRKLQQWQVWCKQQSFCVTTAYLNMIGSNLARREILTILPIDRPPRPITCWPCGVISALAQRSGCSAIKSLGTASTPVR